MSEDEKFSVPEELEEWIGLKKSEYLSVLIEKMAPDDFGFEDFHLFDLRIPLTIEKAERSYEDTVDGNALLTFVRTYSDEKMFHHVVVGTLHRDVFLPIISFVTRSESVVGMFSRGQVRTRPVMN